MNNTRERLHSVDLLRGLVMVLMALDHVRDFFSDALWFNIVDPKLTNAPLFATRWVTHYCAPTFMLLAGVGAALSEQRGLSKPHLARFLFTRGLWLVFLELTFVHLSWFFSFEIQEMVGAVIWALGWCMVLLAGLQFLPRPVLLAFALILIFGHNYADRWTSSDFGSLGWLWNFLHFNNPDKFDPVVLSENLNTRVTLFAPYKIIPWVGVMALGYTLGPIFQYEAKTRRRIFFGLGLWITLAFLVNRGINEYGDPTPWTMQPTLAMTIVSFLNCEKYPPSLCYLLMTLGPAFLLLSAFDREPGWLGRRLIVFGRVPLFFYLLHLPLIHGLAVLASYFQHNGVIDAWLLSPPSKASPPQGYGYSLLIVYALWIAVVFILYPPCRWFAEQKRRHPGGWRSYF